MAAVNAPASPTAVTRRSYDSLPGPPGVPLLGNSLQLDPSRFHAIAENWKRQYGDLFRFRLGGKRVIAVGDPEEIGRLLRDRPGTFGRGERLERITLEMGIKGLFSSNGAAWQRQRPMVMAAFAPNHVKGYFPSLAAVTERLARRWQAAADQGLVIDLQADLMRYTVDVTAGLAFGATVNTLESDADVIQEHINYIFEMLGKRLFAPVAYWRILKLPRDRKLDRHLVAIHAAVQNFIARARGRIDANPALREDPSNLIEAMLVARDSPASHLDDADVAGNVLTMLLAGEDTTANTLAWLIYLLARNPEALAQATAESRAVVGNASCVKDFERLQDLVYCEACVHESMRLKPVAPFLFLEAYQDTQVQDVAIPAHTLVMLLLRGAAVDARQFEEPESFEPARWLDEGAGRAVSPKRLSMPFGGGPRLCPGRYLALLEIKMVLAMLLANFDLAFVGSSVGATVEERLKFTMEPVDLKMRLARHVPVEPAAPERSA